MKGRKPKPTALKVLAGNPGNRPLNPAEPVAVGDLVEPPAFFNERKREIWYDALRAAPKDVLKQIDQSLLMTWVIAFEAMEKATLEADQHPGGVSTTTKGETKVHPSVTVQTRMAALLLKASGDLGFTPSARSRFRLGDLTPKKVNAFAALKSVK
jgi:P27 family predicted phage terminase small subunit